MSLYNALIRTHHITSRKKVTKLKQAADACDVFALIRSGGCPGIMYVEGREDGVRRWVGVVHNLRYKDYQLATRPAALVSETSSSQPSSIGTDKQLAQQQRGLHETDSVKDFAARMHARGVYAWWRRGMGFTADDE
ncbi:hypothetical protein AAFC00_000605 [Neodothiora populina]|uniref:Uncharacterized protein n=1 Tax=Neodothiora populina TaxID=2781224 RepID=A0ABR3PDF1_9PEZI